MAMQALQDRLAATDAEQNFWSSTLLSATPDDSNSFGLFSPSECMGSTRADLSASLSWPLLQPSPIPEAVPSKPVDQIDRICQHLNHMPGMADPFAFSTLPPANMNATAKATALHHHISATSSYKRPHQLPGSSLLPSSGKLGRRAMLPHEHPFRSDMIMILDSDDNIIGTSSSLTACASMLGDLNLNFRHSISKNAGWHSLHQLGKFSDLLADGHAVLCWQQACRSIKALRISSRLPGADTQNHFKRHHREMVLKRRSQGHIDEFIEVKVVETNNGHLMVQVRPLTLPMVAATSSHRSTSHAPAQPHLPHLSTRLQSLFQQIQLASPELRLLVSRSGLILRISCTNITSTTPNSHCCARAILGHAVQPPLFGQSLVEVAQLVPLLHVVAQAAMVGLAQTVDLFRAGAKVQAMVQPVLRSARGAARTSVLPAAKVWITLSVPSAVQRRISSTSISTNHHLLSSERQGLTPERHCIGPERRHSEQLSGPESISHPLGWPQAEISHEDWPAVMSQPNPRASERQHQRVREPALPEDSLSAHVHRLREENRILRAQLQARLSARHLTMQQRRGPRIQ